MADVPLEDRNWNREPHPFRARAGRGRAGEPRKCRRCGRPEEHGLHHPEAQVAQPAAPKPDTWWTVADVVERFFPSLKPRQIAGMIRRGHFPNARKVGRTWLVPESDVAGFGEAAQHG